MEMNIEKCPSGYALTEVGDCENGDYVWHIFDGWVLADESSIGNSCMDFHAVARKIKEPA